MDAYVIRLLKSIYFTAMNNGVTVEIISASLNSKRYIININSVLYYALSCVEFVDVLH